MNYIQERHANVDYSKFSDNPNWEQYLSYACGDEEFGLFLAFTDRRCQKLIGVDLFSLEDFMSRDCFDSGMTPQETAVEAILNDDLYRNLLGFEVNIGTYY